MDTRKIGPQNVQTCILYDPADGKIRHSHKVLTYAGGKRMERTEVEKRARELASKLGHDPSKFKVLHLEDGQDYHGAHSVDLETGTLKHSPRRERKT